MAVTRASLLLTLLCLPAAASAQSETVRHRYEVLSNAALAGSLVPSVEMVTKSQSRPRASAEIALRYGVSTATVAVLKRLIHRERPCHVEHIGCGREAPNTSFPSGHAATAAIALGAAFTCGETPSRGRVGLAVSLAGLTMAGRVGAKKHWVSDVVLGAAIGIASGMIRLPGGCAGS